MAACDLLLLPSRWEGIAVSIFEAMATGLVVVGAAVGGQRELLPPDCGLLLPVLDPQCQIQAYADTLATVLPVSERRRAMGARARVRVRAGFDLDGMVDRFSHAIDRARRSRERREGAPLAVDLAEESAKQAIRCLRLARRADVPSIERDGLRARASSDGVAGELVSQLAAEQRIADIEASRSWRIVQRLRRSAPVRAWARLRFGPGWALEPPVADPQLRLARVEASRSFRLIQALKRTPIYVWYARRRWPDWEHRS
jgi:hypothetical protein